MRAVAVIPARAGSKGLPDKNAMPVAGVPMVVRAISALRSAGQAIEKILVSTDSPLVARLSTEAGATVVERPAALASDMAGVDSAARHALRTVYPDDGWPEFTLLVQPNLPVWQPGIVATVLERLGRGDCTAAASCFSVDTRPEWMKRITPEGYAAPFLPAEAIPIRRQDFPPLIYFDGAVVGVRTSVMMESEGRPVSHISWLGPRVAPVIRPELYGLEVHSAEDIVRAEAALLALERSGG